MALTLATRLCHDFAGIVGALTAALDMAADGQEADALPLAQDCARELAARLRLLRAAFGDGEIDLDPAELAAGLPGAERLAVDLSGVAPGLDGVHGRLAANLLLLAARSLPRGGAIGLSAAPAAFTLEVAGPRAAWPEALARSLAAPENLAEAAGQPREVGVAMLCLLAGAMGLRITVDGETRLRVA